VCKAIDIRHLIYTVTVSTDGFGSMFVGQNENDFGGVALLVSS
jgi:hypothetical protein